MAATKTSALTAITGANLATTDLFHVVDVSDTTMAASGTNKKVTREEAFKNLPPLSFSTDAFITRYAAKQVMISGDGVGAGVNAGWIAGYEGVNSGYGALWASTAVSKNTTDFALRATNGYTLLNALTQVQIGTGGSAKLTIDSTPGAGPSITAGTATTDVNALSLTQTWNNAAVTDGVKWTFTNTSAAAAASYLRILAGSAGTSPVLVGRKNGDLELGTDQLTAAQGYSRLAIKHATTTVTAAAGATVTATNLIPAKANVLGVNTVVTTAIGNGSGTTGYAVGDGTDPNRWGDVVGITAGTDSDGNDATADPKGFFVAANNVVLTAAGGNFDGTGAIFIDVIYTLTEAD